MSEQSETAVSVKDECADVYWESVKGLPDSLRRKVSVRDLRDIFNTCVMNSVGRARELDRAGRDSTDAEGEHF